jgi:hypothetical protein
MSCKIPEFFKKSHLSEAEKTAKTRGNRVTKMLPQIPNLPMSSPKKCQFFAKTRRFYENILVLSDWTKPLRSSVSPGLIYNA